jgi:hypothetical protein
VPDRKPLRTEVMHVEPAPEYLTTIHERCRPSTCYAVQMYNYAEHMTTQALVDTDAGDVIDVSYQVETQPELTPELEDLAWKIALNTPEVLAELGIDDPGQLDEGTERFLRKTSCEQSRHLCAAPTFHVGDRVLWTIVDITDGRVVGVRSAGDENLKAAPPSEARLLGEHVDATMCREPTRLSRGDWEMDTFMTRSDGLRLTDIAFQGKPVLRSTKLVDWHVSYDREQAFGYSDAVGCPFFSSAAVVAMQLPEIEPIVSDGEEVGFAIVQDYEHPLWPGACMYNYRQRYEFYDDGRFRLGMASNGGGCGNDGTYRPVQRIVPPEDGWALDVWDGEAWAAWEREGWRLQDDSTPVTAEGFQLRLRDKDGAGYYVEPGRGQFGDGGRGDNAFVFLTRYRPDEGDDDMFTIGPCCNTDYRQGPEQFFEPDPEELPDGEIVVWYVPQLENDDTPGDEYCWARSVVEDGLYATEYWPCFAGPMFVPIGG